MLTGRRYDLVFVTSLPPIRMRPAVGSSSPAIRRSVVVLPQPDGPSSAKNDPAGIVRSRCSIAVNPGNRFVMPTSSRSAPDSAKLVATAQAPSRTLWNAAPNVCSSAPVRLRKTLTVDSVSSSGKISWFSASSGSISTIASLAPTTGVM